LFILFPIGHKDAVVDRLPYVTIAIIVLNILIFLVTGFSKSKLEKLYMEKLEQIVEFYSRHADLDIEEIIQDDNRQLKAILYDLKERYANNWGNTSSTIRDKNEFIQLIDELNQIKYSVPSYKYGVIPSNAKLFNYFSSMFMHGGFFHLFFNMIFLWIAGCTIEDKWGRPLYLGFYLLSGIMASFAHVLMFPNSIIPLIGASGAIAGTMGAFLIRMYKTKIRIFYYLVFVHAGTAFVPAYVALPFWFLQQIYFAIFIPNAGERGGVAFWAHIGGFVFGTVVAVIIKKYSIEEKYIRPNIEKQISIEQHPKLLSAMEKFDLENFDEAILDIQEFLRIEPNHLDANNLLAQIYLKQNKKLDAAQAYGKIVPIYLSQKDNALALATFMDMRNLSPDAVLSPRYQMNIAHLLEAEGNTTGAIQAYEKLVEKYPAANESMKAAVNCGFFYLEAGKQPGKALEFFQKAREKCDLYPEWKERIEDGFNKANQLMNNPQGGVLKENAKIETGPSSKDGESVEVHPASSEIVRRTIVFSEMKISKLYQSGIMLENGEHKGLFKWDRIRYIGVGHIDLNQENTKSRRVIDLIYEIHPNMIKLLRIVEEKIDYTQLFNHNTCQDRQKALQSLLKVLFHHSKAPLISMNGNHQTEQDINNWTFPKFTSLKSYEESIISRLSKIHDNRVKGSN